MDTKRSYTIAAAAMAGVMANAGPADATAVFSADVSAILTIIGVSEPGTQVQGNFNTAMMQAQKQEATTGVATALASGGVDVMVGGTAQLVDVNANPLGSGSVPPGAAMFLGDSLVQTGSAFGAATDGSSLAGFFSTGLQSMENFDALNGFTVDFELTYSYSGTASVSDTALESAAANIKIQLLSLASGDVFDPIAAETTADGDGSFAGSGTLSFTISDFFGFEQLTLLADAYGSAVGVPTEIVVAVPAPSALAGLGAGLLGLVGVRHRRRRMS